eukprot:3140798-Pleurochrysis_carterae.AAC.2
MRKRQDCGACERLAHEQVHAHAHAFEQLCDARCVHPDTNAKDPAEAVSQNALVYAQHGLTRA